MAGFILGTKSEGGQNFTEKGARIPYTKIITSPCFLIGVKTIARDGYIAAIIGASLTKNLKKSKGGNLKKAGIETPLRFFKEIRLDKLPLSLNIEITQKDGKDAIKIDEIEIAVGDEIKASALFIADEMVTVTARSKGKGFAGVVKRHKFAGGPATHGQSDRERAPGSIGQSNTPGRVFKGMRMAGRMGNRMTTVKNLKVIDAQDNDLTLSGFVPGTIGGLVIVKTA